ncbi:MULTISPECIES: hypothetical protein, partial [spotted fever group]
MSDKEFRRLEAFKEQVLKIAIAEGIDDFKNNKIHDSTGVYSEV